MRKQGGWGERELTIYDVEEVRGGAKENSAVVARLTPAPLREETGAVTAHHGEEAGWCGRSRLAHGGEHDIEPQGLAAAGPAARVRSTRSCPISI